MNAPVHGGLHVLPEHILVVEDNALIAMDLEDQLKAAGALTVSTASTVALALDEIVRCLPGVALLDIDLGTEDCFPIADRLADLGVPFVFTTGYCKDFAIPDKHGGIAHLVKPYDCQVLIEALTAVSTAPVAAK
jgi:CheY-like chemotaxis protein